MITIGQAYHGKLDRRLDVEVSKGRTTQHLESHEVLTHTRRMLYRFHTHFHPYAERLVQTLVERDINGLQVLDTATPELREEYFDATYGPVTANAIRDAADVAASPPAAVLRQVVTANGQPVQQLLPVKELDFDYATGAYAVYNWEVFYHVPFTLALQLSRNGRFAEAQHWFHYIFDPTDNGPGPTPQRFWQVKPFRINEVEQIATTLFNLSTGDDANLQERTIAAIGAWRDNPFRPHLVARTRPTAYMYATVMAYLDNLIAWGDSLFRQDTRESINEAMQYYVLAANILGPRPQVVPKRGTLRSQRYKDLRASLDEFGNAVRELEADIPFDLLGSGTPTGTPPSDVVLESVGRSLYFGVPRNDKLLGYWSTVGDRLYKIRNSLNIDGVFRQLPLFAPPIDPAMLARAVAAGVDVASIIAGTAAPLAPVRFPVLLQKALEMCQEVKSLGGQVLAAIEKKDGEALGVLRAKHESNMLAIAETIRYAQWQEAAKNREGISINLQNAFDRFRYYERLLGRDAAQIKAPEYTALDTAAVEQKSLSATEPVLGADEVKVQIGGSFRGGGHKLNPSEGTELDLMEAAQIAQDLGTILEGIGAVLNLIPEIEGSVEPFGLGAGAQFGGSNLGHLFQGLAAVSRGVGSRLQHESTMAGKMASYDRREQDWASQRRAAAGELTQLYKQYRAAELREHIAKREYENHQRQLAQARDVEDFLTNERRKTTTQDFYLWMKREAQGLHSRCFQFAYDLAQRAERALQHELGEPGASFIGSTYMAGREGLFAGEKLYLDLRRLDFAYAEMNKREDEITKEISLREWFPVELMELRNTGSCTIDVPEAIFDLDCPGQVFRRIRTVALSIPSVTGPHVSVNARLTLLQSTVRTKGTLLANAWYPANVANPDTERFASFPALKTSIVTSGALNDSGMFDPNAREDRPLPFEGAGAISQWKIELLGDPPAFDYDTISDVLLTMQYTARAGAPAGPVSAAATKWYKEHAARVLSMRHEFPDAWARFVTTNIPANGTASLSFTLSPRHFPYRMRGNLTKARKLHLFASTAGNVNVELFREGVSVGQTALANGEGTITPPPANNNPGTFDPVANLELRFDSTALTDLWVVVDWE